MVIADSKDLYHELSSKRNTVNKLKSVRPDVNSMRLYFETVIDIFVWIEGSLNIADVGTKQGSSLTDSLVLTLATGNLQTDLSNCELSRRENSYGYLLYTKWGRLKPPTVSNEIDPECQS